MMSSIKRRRRNANRQHFLDSLECDLINNHWDQRKLSIRHNRSVSVISRAIQEIVRDRWRIDDRSEIIDNRRLRIKQHEKIYTDEMNAWEESKRPKREITRTKMPCGSCRATGIVKKDDHDVECSICNGTGIRIETTFKVSKSSGASVHHNTALKALAEICKLEALYPEKRSSTRVSMNTDGSLRIDSIYDNADPDDILDVMAALENLTDNARQKMQGKVIEVEPIENAGGGKYDESARRIEAGVV